MTRDQKRMELVKDVSMELHDATRAKAIELLKDCGHIRPTEEDIALAGVYLLSERRI